jgi:hypothetical protein
VPARLGLPYTGEFFFLKKKMLKDPKILSIIKNQKFLTLRWEPHQDFPYDLRKCSAQNQIFLTG